MRVSLWFLLLWAMRGVAQPVAFDARFEVGPILPPWTGQSERFVGVEREGEVWLQAQGLPRADTLHLAHPFAMAWGEWTFTVRWSGMTWSTANGVRVYLVASEPNLRGPQTGYFVQIGTNNTRDVRLIRQDGDPSQTSRRVTLIASPPIAEGTSGEVQVRVTRSFAGVWSLWVNDLSAGSATDVRYTSSAATGVWVKHSATAGSAVQIGRWSARGFVTPPDTLPPTLLSHDVSEGAGRHRIALRFSEPVNVRPQHTRTIAGSELRVDPQTPEFIETWALVSDALLPEGAWPLALTGVSDPAGNALRDTTIEVRIVRDRVPPRISQRERLDDFTYRLHFSEPVLGACTATAYLSATFGRPDEVQCATGEPVAEVVVRWSSSPPLGVADTVRLSDVRDVAGNALALSLTTLGRPAAVHAGSIVLNEFLYSPDPIEFVELYNRSNTLLDLLELRLSDDRLGRVVISPSSSLIGPGEFVVLVRDAVAFRNTFPEAIGMGVAGFPALNNTVDAIILHTAAGLTVDSLTYSSSWGPSGRSLERIDPAAPSRANNFAPSEHLSGATPGFVNTRYHPDLTGPRLLRAEMRSPTLLTLHFDEPVATAPLPEVRAGGALGEVATDSQHSQRLNVTFADLSGVTELHVGTVFDVLGNASTPGRFPLARLAEAGELVVNELHFDPVTLLGDSLPQQPEWMELLNASPHFLSLSDLFITGDASPTTGLVDTFRIQATSPVLAPGAFALIYQRHSSDVDPRTQSRLKTAYPALPTHDSTLVLIPVTQVTSGGLRLSGKRLRLERPGHVMDNVAYSPAWVDGSRARTRGYSLERLHPALPAENPLSWATSRDPEGGTPGRTNSQRPSGLPAPAPGEIALTEILFTPATERGQVAFLEVEHTGSRAVDLNGLLFVRSDTARLVFEPHPLAPGERRVFFPVSSGGFSSDPRVAFREAFPGTPTTTLQPVRASAFSLLTTSAHIRLLNAERVQLDAVHYSSAWHDPQISPLGRSLERISTAAPTAQARNWGTSVDEMGATPGRPNSLSHTTIARGPLAGDLVLNEILYEPSTNPDDGHPDQTDFIELLNISPDALELNGLQFIRMPDEVGRADTVRLVFRPLALQPGEFLVVFAQAGTYATHPDPAQHFRAVYALGPEIKVIPVRTSAFTLVSAGAHIGLLSAEGTLIESVRYAPNWHSGTLRITRGVSLERRDPHAPAALAHNWSSSADVLGATPGRVNSLTVQPADELAEAGLRIGPSPFTPEEGTFIRYRLRAPDATVRVRMFDLQGRVVRELVQGALSGPQGVLHWDGLGENGEALRLGPYVVHVEAVSPENGTVEAYRKPVVLARPLGR